MKQLRICWRLEEGVGFSCQFQGIGGGGDIKGLIVTLLMHHHRAIDERRGGGGTRRSRIYFTGCLICIL
eukprot:scaffold28_cov180-Chaetoceros_neogracile.AAC.9